MSIAVIGTTGLQTFANLASASIGIALLIPIIIEGGRSIMVLKEFLTRELTKKAVGGKAVDVGGVEQTKRRV